MDTTKPARRRFLTRRHSARSSQNCAPLWRHLHVISTVHTTPLWPLKLPARCPLSVHQRLTLLSCTHKAPRRAAEQAGAGWVMALAHSGQRFQAARPAAAALWPTFPQVTSRSPSLLNLHRRGARDMRGGSCEHCWESGTAREAASSRRWSCCCRCHMTAPLRACSLLYLVEGPLMTLQDEGPHGLRRLLR